MANMSSVRRLIASFARSLLRPKSRLTFLRLIFSLASVAFVLVLLSSKKSPVDSTDTVGDNVISHSIKNSLQLSAKDLKYFHSLNPVRAGWGNGGEGVTLTDATEKKMADKQFKAGAFNVFVSDRISPNRTLEDPRPYECSKLDYTSRINELGTASVIIIFTDEIWSALIRTVWSVWNRTPDKLLKEIILVDDSSSKKELGEPLVKYMSHYFGHRIRIFRTGKREGLIRARIMGAKHAAGDVLIFLDSHCEVATGWMEPLLETIAKDRTNVVCPVIDVISDKTLEYSRGYPYYFQVGGFTWSGHFTWIDVPDDYTKKHPTTAIASPTMAGGLFAMDKNYFFEVGAYDEAMEIWGGENLEMSFRVWQCGGTLLIHPCSHVGHIFRDYHPYSFQGKDTHGINTLRTVLVWMDAEYHKYFFMYRNDLQNRRAGDLSSRFKLKTELKCKSFSWYLDNVYKGTKFVYDRNVQAHGFVRNPINNLCLDILNRDEEKTNPLAVYICSPRPESSYTNQVFSFMKSGQIRREETCVTAGDDGDTDGEVQMARCIEETTILGAQPTKTSRKKKTQRWIHSNGGQIKNVATRQCLTTRDVASSSDLKMAPCDPDDMNQIFWFQSYTKPSVY